MRNPEASLSMPSASRRFGPFLLLIRASCRDTTGEWRIVNVGAGRLPLPLLGPGYGAKLAMEAMSDILRVELRGTGVRVSIVEPGMTRWDDAEEQLAVYAQALDDSLKGVPAKDRPRFEDAARKFKLLNRRMMATAAPADRVAATIQRASQHAPSRPLSCGWEQKAFSWWKSDDERSAMPSWA